jgi:hypothetical protein
MPALRIAALWVVLGGCAADPYSALPAFMRAKAPQTPPPEEQPAVAAIVREQLSSLFLESSLPHHIQVSAAHRDPRALDWIACVKAEVNSGTGRPMGSQIYRITIAGGKIIDRRLSDNDNCSTEHFEPI